MRIIEQMASDLSIYNQNEIVAGYKIMSSGEYIGVIGLVHDNKLIGNFWYENDSYKSLTAHISKKYLL